MAALQQLLPGDSLLLPLPDALAHGIRPALLWLYQHIHLGQRLAWASQWVHSSSTLYLKSRANLQHKQKYFHCKY